MKTLRLDVSRALSVEYHRTETWMLLCSACLGKLAGRGERKEREKVVYSRGKLKPTFIVANNPTSRAGVPGSQAASHSNKRHKQLPATLQSTQVGV